MEFTKQRLARETVEKVEDLLKQGFTYSQIVKQTGVSKASISKIKNRTYKKAPVTQEPINEKEYAILKEKYLKLNKEYTLLKNTYIKIYKENIQLKKNNKFLRNYTNDLKKFESYITDLGYFIDYLRYNSNFNTTSVVEEHYHDNRSINIYSNSNSMDDNSSHNNLINNKYDDANILDINWEDK